MDIISAHQQGLIEQLDEEIAALSGRPRDFSQRAVVLYHLYDHSRGSFDWALIEARRSLRIAAGLKRLERKLKRWGWLMPRRSKAVEALKRLHDALGDASRARCSAARRAYRLSAVSALRTEAEISLPGDLLLSLDQCHAARRSGATVSSEVQIALAAQCDDLAATACDAAALEAAWAGVEATRLGRAAQRLIGDKALSRAAARDHRRGSARIERELRADEALPASFRANPAQHFYSLQQLHADRRRQQWREACDREPDAFELAA
jgi:hypothetical protein